MWSLIPLLSVSILPSNLAYKYIAQNKFNWFVQVLKQIIIYADLESRPCVLAKWMMQTIIIYKGFQRAGY